jgi:hypothetical protein
MPDHLHLFLCGPDDFILGRWIGALKQALGKTIDWTKNSDPIWQRAFFSIMSCAVKKVTGKMELRSRKPGARRTRDASRRLALFR